jgi:hypothetical protein
VCDDVTWKADRKGGGNQGDANPEERMNEVYVGWKRDANADENKSASRDDRDHKAPDFGRNPQRTHGGRIRECLNRERSYWKQKEGLSALSPRAF